MKKLMVILLLVCLVLPITVLADVSLPDLTEYTTEDLVALKTLIAQEMLERGIEKQATIPIGKYTIGVDIPAGTYSVKPVKSGFDFKIYPNANKTGAFDSIYYEYVRSTESIGKIELLEGQILEIDANVILTVYTGINFF